jgi:ribosome-associated heat shock protein Hsp15
MGDTIRLDRFLWFARIVKTRPLAQALAESGHFRIDGRKIERAHCPVRVGNILTFATASGRVRVLRVEALPVRRGPAPEAAACYQELLTDNVSQQGGGD